LAIIVFFASLSTVRLSAANPLVEALFLALRKIKSV